MAEQLGILARTHTCGALRPADVGENVVLLGWVHRVRDLGSLLFLDVRDRHGLTQVIVEGDEALLERAKRLRSEFVVAVLGEVERRSPETVNPKLPTGEVEVARRKCAILNEAKTPPFSIAEDQNVSEETRLKYRLPRSAPPAAAAQHRPAPPHHDGAPEVFRRAGLLRDRNADPDEVDARRARDFLVPSRVHPGEFYALPQSPQIFKQILMIAGLRSLRADRALLPRRGAARRSAARVHAGGPRDVVCDAAAGLRDRRRRAGGLLRRDRRRASRGRSAMPYAEAIAKYGSDKPDLRCGIEIQDFGPLFARVAVRSFARRSRTAAPFAASS